MKPVDVLQSLEAHRQAGIPCVLAIVVEGLANTPGRSGFKMLVRADGSIEGTVGGGSMEEHIRREALNLFEIGGTRYISYSLTPEQLGMLCGGEAKIFLEYFAPIRRAYLFGAGHLCRSLTPLLRTLGFGITVIDDRPGMASSKHLPDADRFHDGEYGAFFANFNPTPEDAAVVFTHGHVNDHSVVDCICARGLPMKYIGMIGSRNKVAVTLDKVRAANHSGALVERVWAPIGLNVGRTTPQEIAVAIAAEILAVYNGVDVVKHMRDG
jgi:xanthine dehydrogenase accessory factor